MRSIVALIVLAGLAGCADTPAPPAVIDVGEPLAFVDIVQERPVLASLRIQETPKQGAADSGLLGSQRWDAREAELSYHGLGEVHDEWGRLLTAHVFRYNPMVYTITSMEFDSASGTFDIDGEYQERRWEMYFDAADGRNMGLTDLDRGVRSFADPDIRMPFGSGYIGGMLLSMIGHMKGDIEAPVSLEWGEYNHTSWLEPYDGQRPLPGDCDMFIRKSKTEGPGTPAPAKPNADPHRTIACFDQGMVPLWHWSGNQTHGHLALERLETSFAWPGPQGDVLPPAPFAASPMEAIAAPVPSGDPLYVPPSDGGDDWAAAVRDRVAALHYSIPYQRYDLTHGPAYAHHVVTGWPAHAFGGLPLDDLTDVARFEETSWVMVTEEEWLWTNVHTLATGEGGRRFVADQNGFTFPDSDYPAREDLGDVVETASVRGRVPELSPHDPRTINWMMWPDFGSSYAPQAWWTVASHCFEEAEDPRFLMFDGIDGHLLGAGGMASRPNGCSMGTYSAFVDGQEVTVVPASPDRPFPIVLDLSGQLVLPLPPEAAAWDGVRFYV